MSDPASDATWFVEAMRLEFDPPDGIRHATGYDLIWVNGGVAPDGSAVVLYRTEVDSQVYGRRWDMVEMARDFGGTDPAELAGDMWSNEICPQDQGAQLLDVDWADGLVDDPRLVRWFGEPHSPAGRVRQAPGRVQLAPVLE